MPMNPIASFARRWLCKPGPPIAFALLSLTQTAAARPPLREPIDATRLDVQRLPPEALTPDRALYRVGLHVRAELGGQSASHRLFGRRQRALKATLRRRKIRRLTIRSFVA